MGVNRQGRNPDVTVAPSTVRGEATGPAIDADARLLEGGEYTRAARLIDGT
jgi:hypothetical protein